MYQQRTALHQSMLYICCIKCTPSNKWLKVKGEGSKLWSRMGAGCDGRMLASLSAIGPTCPSVCSSCSATQLTLFTNNQHCQLSVAGGPGLYFMLVVTAAQLPGLHSTPDPALW